ncbi:Pantothenate kinase type III, CoaX-like [hydrothermal vent metagenome]|uniref:Type III pantothenate kinase n=1 Tax=hydrothermal vent metagenome TaxID=652676 RepID=A0A1W1E8P5_9ZZZZ
MSNETLEYRLLADIGNSRIHIYDGKEVVHLLPDEAISRYAAQKLYYISVNHHLEARIQAKTLWENISERVYIDGEYKTMGVDRRALCLSHESGVFVDAGSAITVDIVEESRYVGGFILPGIKAYLNAYGAISPILKVSLDDTITLQRLPTTTKGQISYGIIASIKVLIAQHSKGKSIYFTGGDGKLLSAFFEHACYDETLVFQGMKQALGMSEKLKIKN